MNYINLRKRGILFQVLTRLWCIIGALIVIPIFVVVYSPYYFCKQEKVLEAVWDALKVALLPWGTSDVRK